MKEPPHHGHASDSTLSPQGPLLCSAFLGFTGPPPLFHGPRDVQSHSFQSSISVKKGADSRIKGPRLLGALPFLSCDHGPAAQWYRSPATAGQSCPVPRRGRAPAGGARLTPAGSVYFARLQCDVFPGRFTWKLDRPGLSSTAIKKAAPLCPGVWMLQGRWASLPPGSTAHTLVRTGGGRKTSPSLVARPANRKVTGCSSLGNQDAHAATLVPTTPVCGTGTPGMLGHEESLVFLARVPRGGLPWP